MKSPFIQPAALRSKKTQILPLHEMIVKGPLNVGGTRPPQDDKEPFMMTEIQAFGCTFWVPVSEAVPQVTGADSVVLEAIISKTKSGKTAFRPGALLKVVLDGDVVWTGSPVDLGEVDLNAGPVTAQDLKAATKSK